MALGRGNDRKGAPVPRKNTLNTTKGNPQNLGKGRNTGPVGGVGSGYGPPGTDKPKGRLY